MNTRTQNRRATGGGGNLALASLLLGVAYSQAQSLPASLPTQAPAPATVKATPATAIPTALAAGQPAYQARVEYEAGELYITAANSSLNQILREVAHLNGMKITGGVKEERVFGTYGPGSPDAVLNQLLDGSGSNVLLHEDKRHAIKELVLTPRQGGPTPPSPGSAAARTEDPVSNPVPPDFIRTGAEEGRRGGSPNRPVLDSSRPVPTENPSTATTPSQPELFVPNPPADSSAPPSPGAQTPQQVFEQLMKLQQQQQPTAPQP